MQLNPAVLDDFLSILLFFRSMFPFSVYDAFYTKNRLISIRKIMLSSRAPVRASLAAAGSAPVSLYVIIAKYAIGSVSVGDSEQLCHLNNNRWYERDCRPLRLDGHSATLVESTSTFISSGSIEEESG